MLGLTAVFEMVTGVSPAPWAPTIILLSSNTSVDVHQTELDYDNNQLNRKMG